MSLLPWWLELPEIAVGTYWLWHSHLQCIATSSTCIDRYPRCRCLTTSQPWKINSIHKIPQFILVPMAGHAHCSNSYHAAVAQSLLYVAQTALLIACATHGNILHARGALCVVQTCRIIPALRRSVFSCVPEKSGMQAVKWFIHTCDLAVE